MWPFTFFSSQMLSLAGGSDNERWCEWECAQRPFMWLKKKEERRKWNASKVRCARTHRQCRNWNSILRSPSKNSNVKMWFFCLSLLVCQCHCQSAPLMCGVVAVQAGARACVCVSWMSENANGCIIIRRHRRSTRIFGIDEYTILLSVHCFLVRVYCVAGRWYLLLASIKQ